MKHLINWIEIPVVDMDRACAFYGHVLGVGLQGISMLGAVYAFFPTVDRFNAGALVKANGHLPSAHGPLVYLDGGADLTPMLARVAAAGGKVLQEKTYLSPEAGHVGLFVDTEGNRVGLQHP